MRPPIAIAVVWYACAAGAQPSSLKEFDAPRAAEERQYKKPKVAEFEEDPAYAIEPELQIRWRPIAFALMALGVGLWVGWRYYRQLAVEQVSALPKRAARRKIKGPDETVDED